MQRHLFRQRKNILLGISMGIFMISVLGGTQNVKGLGATTDSAPQYEDLPSSACEVQNGENIQWFLDDPNCNIITVQPGKYKQRWLNAHRDNVTLKCAVLGACELASIEVFGNHNVVDGFVITSKEYKTGLRTMGNDNLITNNEIYHMKEDGMWLWGKNNVIRGNYIHDIYHPDLPQYPGYDEHVDCFMTFSWSWPIDNMVIEDNLCVLDRQNGSNQFYILTHSGSAPFKNITIRNNVFIAKDSGYVPVAFFGDSTVTGVRIINNTFYNVSGQGANPVYLDHMPNTYVANNVSIGYTGDIVRNINSSALVENNITRPPYGMQNVQGYDFHLLTGSPLIDSGVPSGIAYDFDGNPRDERPDIGAFEYVTNTPPTEMPSPTITVMPTGGNAPSPLPGLNWEAEHGEITAPFAVLNGIVSQNVLTSNPADGGRALYRFTILEAGNYNIKAVVNAADANSNSFFVNMDTEPDISMIWDVPMTNGFEERFVSWREDIGPNGIASNAKVFSLSSGEHTLIIRGRESTVLLDSLEVVGASMSAEPTSTVPLPPTETQNSLPNSYSHATNDDRNSSHTYR